LTAHRFYIKKKPQESTYIFLEGEEHHHLSKVARIGPGEQVWLFEENGKQYRARVEAIEPLLKLEKNRRKKWKGGNALQGKSLRDILMYPLIEKIEKPSSIILLVGPEGGWTESEEQDIMDNHYEAVSLGSLTLRSETAAIVSLAMVSHFWKNDDVS